jgi:hypothetical protein
MEGVAYLFHQRMEGIKRITHFAQIFRVHFHPDEIDRPSPQQTLGTLEDGGFGPLAVDFQEPDPGNALALAELIQSNAFDIDSVCFREPSASEFLGCRLPRSQAIEKRSVSGYLEGKNARRVRDGDLCRADIRQSVESHVLAQRAECCWRGLKRENLRFGMGRSKSDGPHANVCTNIEKYRMTSRNPAYHLGFGRVWHKPPSSPKLGKRRRGESRIK